MKLGVTLDILNQKGTPAFFADTLANRPAAGFTGRVFISTDTLDLYRDTGTTWVLLSPSSTGTITGSGAAGQVTYFSAASSITGSNNLFWDSANNHLGIQTATPDCALDVNHNGTFVAKFNNTTSANTLIGIFNLDNPQWLIGSNSVANDLTFYDATNSPTLVATTTMKTDGTTFIGGQTTGSGRLNVYSATGDNGIQISGANAPSLRIDNAPTGATKRIGLGISTATNNFIQGSTDRDMCIFNGSTTASPMLFGIYGTTNVQEAARISAARNFLVGTNVDAGYKLAVSGSSNFTQTSNGATIEVLRLTNSGAGANTQAKLQFNAAGTNYSSISGGYGSSAPQLTYDVPFGNHVFTGSAISAQCDLGVVGLVATSSRLVINGAIDDAVTALQVSGSGKFSNFVGINGSPATAFPLEAYINSSTAYTTSSRGNVFRVYNTNTNTNIYAGIELGGTGATNDGLASINAVVSSNGSGTLTFVTRNSSSFSEKMRIEATGNLLIGTTTDDGNKFQVNGTAYINGFTNIGVVNNGIHQLGVYVSGGADRNILQAAVNGVSNGFRVRYDNATSTVRVSMTSLPTSSVGLSAGDLWNNLGILNIV